MFSKIRIIDPYIRALIENDGLEEMLAEELEWTTSQGEALMNPEHDLDLLAVDKRHFESRVTQSHA